MASSFSGPTPKESFWAKICGGGGGVLFLMFVGGETVLKRKFLIWVKTFMLLYERSQFASVCQVGTSIAFTFAVVGFENNAARSTNALLNSFWCHIENLPVVVIGTSPKQIFESAVVFRFMKSLH
jgi:hypothetical protein